MFMLQIGNGLQGTLLGIRGEMAGFSTLSMSIVMSGYFIGFMLASRIVPLMIRRVGHVRVFAALGSTISAVLILYPVIADPIAWTFGRIVLGFSFCGVYIAAESWLNNSATNENRGKALSLYMIMQMAGIVFAQFLVTTGDISGYTLFIVASILVSMAFAPILLSVRPTPAFENAKPMSLKELVAASPLAAIGMMFLGGIYAAQFGMSAIYGARVGLSVGQISAMVSVIYIAALVAQYPIGWLSDRMDRRLLIVGLAALGGVGAFVAIFGGSNFYLILISAALMGGSSNPLYSLLIAYANDYLDHEDMASASGGLLFISGLGAIAGPLVVGWAMDVVGPVGFWIYIAVLMLGMAAYGVYRMSKRSTDTPISETVSYSPILASSTPVAAGVAQEVYIETELEEQSS